MLEIIIIAGIVAVVAFMAGRSLYRTMTGKNDGCSCTTGNCRGCMHDNFTKTHQKRDSKL